jgi:phosphoenolpyruvate synthase/pyruvate phosphate dikinase
MAVLVQRFVEAEASAVVFRANPVTGDRDEVVLEAVLGAGQALVEGTMTPERTIVHRGAQRAGRPAISVLSAAQVREVATLAVTLEAREGHPVDLECAYERGTLQLLQCRPLTRTAPE